jgi:choline kinase
MKALILAAGEGKRLYQLTKERPKALVKVAGVSLVEPEFQIKLCFPPVKA